MERSELLTRIAYLYYKDDLTQHQIAQQLGLSRPKIARLLQEARRTGIVRIEITQELPPDQKEAYNLQKLFNLRRAVVVRNEESREATLHALRSAVGSLILENLKETTSIGFSFSQNHRQYRRLYPCRGPRLPRCGLRSYGRDDGVSHAFYRKCRCGKTDRRNPLPNFRTHYGS